MVSTIHTSLLVWFNAIFVYYINCFDNVSPAKILLWCVFFVHICIFFSRTRDFWQNSTENSICFHDHPGESHWYHFRSHSNGGLHSNFLIGIANIDSLPTATMILSISLSLPCPISRSQFFTLQSYDKRKPASTTRRLFLIFCLSSRWLPKKIQKFLA